MQLPPTCVPHRFGWPFDRPGSSCSPWLKRIDLLPAQESQVGHTKYECQRRTSNPLLRSTIFLEYSRSATLTLFSSCSVFACTSFLTARSLSTAASNVRINGFGSNAVGGTVIQGRSIKRNSGTYDQTETWTEQ